MSKEKAFSVYIAPEDSPLTQAEIQTGLQGPKMDDRIRALKSLVIQSIHDEQFPRMIMNVINTLVPIQQDSHLLKKILLFYWEVIEKLQSNGLLKDEMILVCNSLRNDLLHPNEYIRGRTLKLISRIPYKGILEPLQTAIIENIKHKHIYVRRNAVVCLYEIFLNFGDDIFSDLDETMLQLLLVETDLSTKRNAFLLLFHVNQQSALDYLHEHLNTADDAQEFGDIMQVSILELFRKVCKLDPQQKPKLYKSILAFSKSKSPSVLFECANTLTAISPTTISLRIAVSIYMQLIHTQTDNNIKLVVLERLENIRSINPKVLEEQVLELTALLGQQSIDIRKKVLALLQTLVRSEAVQQIVVAITKEIQKLQNDSLPSANEFRLTLLQTAHQMVATFPQSQEAFSQMMSDNIMFSGKLDDQTAQVATSIIDLLTRENNPKIFSSCLKRFYDIQHLLMFKSALQVLGEFAQTTEDAVKAFNEIKRAIGSLPIEPEKQKSATVEEDKQEKKTKVKTVILPDGTYGTKVVEESNGKVDDGEQNSKLREYLMQNSFMASSLVRTLMKLLLRVDQLNKYASQALMIFCATLRYFQQNSSKVDQETIEKLYFAIRIITTPGNTINNIQLFIQQEESKKPEVFVLQQQIQPIQQLNEPIMKLPGDVVIVRQIKKKQFGLNDIDLADEEATEDQSSKKDDQSFVSKLNHIVQLTGYSDPIYAEAFVNIHKYDITFEVLFINRSPKMVQNVQVEFRTGGDSKALERAQGVTLQTGQSTRVRTSIKFSSADIGVIHGAIHYENNAGVEQAYLVTKEIYVDLMDFIYPADIEITTFRKCWAKYEWENRIAVNTQFTDLGKFVQHIEKSLKMRRVIEVDLNNSPSYVCANLYAKTKLDDDFLVNISADVLDGRINGFIRIRSKVKGVVVNLGEKIKQLQIRGD